MNLNRNCDICNSDTANLLYTVHFAKELNEKIPDKYDIVYCNNCGFIFNNTNWDQKDYDEYYSKTTKYSSVSSAGSGGISDVDLYRYNRQIDRIEKIITKDVAILDIGCAKGGLLRTFKSRGYDNLYGIDPSQNSVDILNSFGIDGATLNFHDLSLLNKKFDVVILSQVLEHIYDLKGIKKSIYNILSDNGIIYIDVPNASEYRSHYIKPFHYFDIDHINHFDENSIKNLFFECECLDYNEYSDIVVDDKKYPILYCIFRKKEMNDKFNINYDFIKKIEEYISISKNNENYDCKDIDITKNTFLWGGGAYLRRLLSDNRYFNNLKISGIIDKNQSLKGNKILDCRNNKIEFFTPDIVNNYKYANIIITSALYSKQIYEELKNKYDFFGNIYIIDKK